MCFTEIQVTKFELTDTLTWGVVKDKKYGGYSIPITLDSETADKVRSIAGRCGAESPVCGSILCLRTGKLSETQTEDLLGKGGCLVEVHFTIRDACTEGGIPYLIIEITKLRRVEDPDSGSDSCPEN